MPFGEILGSLFGGGGDGGGGGGTHHTQTIHQRPAWWDQNQKEVFETAKRAFGDEWQDYLDPQHAPTADTIRRMEAARLGPESRHTRDAEALFQHADPRNQEHQVHEENVRRNVGRLAESTTAQRVGRPEERLNRDPRELARDYEDNYRENVINPLREEEEEVRRQEEARIRSLPIHNRPGTRDTGKGQLQRDLKTSAYQAKKRWNSQLHKALDMGQQRAHERALNYRASDIAQLANVGHLQQKDMLQQMEALRLLKDINIGDVDKYYKHGAVKLGLGGKEEDRGKLLRELLYERHKEKVEHPKRNIERQSGIAAQAQSPSSVQHQISTITPGIHETGKDLASNLLFHAGNKWASNRFGFAGGDSVTREALFNSMIDNTDPLETLNKMTRHQLMIGLMKRRKKYNTGGTVSPIQSGAEMARRVATDQRSAKYNEIMDRQLEESKRMREETTPPGRSLMGDILEGVNMGLAVTPGYESLGRPAVVQTHLKRQAATEKRKAAFDLEKEVAKEMEAARRGDHTMAMDERRAKNDEARLGIDRERLGIDRQKAAFEMGHLPGGGESAGDLPTKKMTPAREESIKKAHHQGEQILHTMKAAINAFNHVKDIEGGSSTEWFAEHPGITLGAGPHIAGAITGKKGSKITAASKSVNEFINQARKSGGEGGQRAFAYVTQSKMGKGGLGLEKADNADYYGGSVANSIEDYKEAIRDAKRSGDSPNDIAAMEQKLAEMKELHPFLDEIQRIKEGKSITPTSSQEEIARKIAETKDRLAQAEAKRKSLMGHQKLEELR